MDLWPRQAGVPVPTTLTSTFTITTTSYAADGAPFTTVPLTIISTIPTNIVPTGQPSSSSVTTSPGTTSPSTFSSVDGSSSSSSFSSHSLNSTAPTGGNGTSNGTQVGGGVITSDSSGITAGAAAGIGIGCAVAGIAIGLILAAVLARFRRKKNPTPSSSYNNVVQQPVGYPDDKHAIPLAAVVPAAAKSSPATTGLDLDQYLLESVPDKELAYEVSAIGQLIEQHVDNSYHTQLLMNEGAVRKTLAQAAASFGISSMAPDVVAALALDPKTRRLALRHVLSFVVFSSLDFGSGVGRGGSLSMLPGPIAAFLQAVTPPGARGDGDPAATAAALTRWRTAAAYLLSPKRADRTPLEPLDSSTAPQAAQLASALQTFLAPFAVNAAAAEQHLSEVIQEAARLGYLLLSHPRAWAFDHDGSGGRVAVVCAGLTKLGGQEGRRVVTKPVVVAF